MLEQEAFGDIFILQIQGSSQIVVNFANIDRSNKSDHFTINGDVAQGKKVNDSISVSLKQGNSLYIPKNSMYSASYLCSEPINNINKNNDSNLEINFSLYIMIYTNEVDSFDLLSESVVPLALEEVIHSSNEVREKNPRLLPRHSFDFLGVANSELEDNTSRESFVKEFEGVLKKISCKAIDLMDAGIDQVIRSFLF
jgi:hypothetical protein